MLELKSVESYYGKIQALKGISLAVPAGAVVTILGANGAGKSSTLRTISGLIQPAQGQILFEGESIHKAPPHKIVRLGICQVPEGRDIFMGLTVQENLKMGAFTRKEGQAVEQHQLGVGHQPPCDGQHLLFPAAERSGLLADPFF